MPRVRLRFDPDRERARLAGQVDGQWVPRRVWDGEGMARHALNDAIRSWLAGLPDVAQAYAEAAIAHAGARPAATGGATNAAYIEYVRQWDRGDELFSAAVASWFATGVVHREGVLAALDAWERAGTASTQATGSRMDTVELDRVMTAAVLVSEDARALELFEREERKRAEVLNRDRVRSERTLAAVVARTRLNGDPTSGLVERVRRFLYSKLGEWQDVADYRKPVVWMHIADDLAGHGRSVSDAINDLRALIAQYNERE